MKVKAFKKHLECVPDNRTVVVETKGKNGRSFKVTKIEQSGPYLFIDVEPAKFDMFGDAMKTGHVIKLA